MSKPARASHPKAGASQRQLRVAEEIRHVLSGIFARADFRDPDLASAHITITEVRIGPDLKLATAFFSARVFLSARGTSGATASPRAPTTISVSQVMSRLV